MCTSVLTLSSPAGLSLGMQIWELQGKSPEVIGQVKVSDPRAQKREVGFILAVTEKSPTTSAGHPRGDFTPHQGVFWREQGQVVQPSVPGPASLL